LFSLPPVVEAVPFKNNCFSIPFGHLGTNMQVGISHTRYDLKNKKNPILMKVIKKLMQQGQNSF